MTQSGHFHGLQQEVNKTSEGGLYLPVTESKDDQWFDGFSRRFKDHKMKVHGDEMRPLRITKVPSRNISTPSINVKDTQTKDLRKEENAYWNTEICRAREWLENKKFEIEKQWKRIEGDDQYLPEGSASTQSNNNGVFQSPEGFDQRVGIHMETSTHGVHSGKHIRINTIDDIQGEGIMEPPKKRYRSFLGD